MFALARPVADNPDRVDLKRGLARSLVRANQPEQAIAIWNQILATPEATNDDRVNLADALIRTNDWAGAKAELDRIPPTYETYDRYRLEAMVACLRHPCGSVRQADRRPLEKQRPAP